jgi:hypothetical protein
MGPKTSTKAKTTKPKTTKSKANPHDKWEITSFPEVARGKKYASTVLRVSAEKVNGMSLTEIREFFGELQSKYNDPTTKFNITAPCYAGTYVTLKTFDSNSISFGDQYLDENGFKKEDFDYFHRNFDYIDIQVRHKKK